MRPGDQCDQQPKLLAAARARDGTGRPRGQGWPGRWRRLRGWLLRDVTSCTILLVIGFGSAKSFEPMQDCFHLRSLLKGGTPEKAHQFTLKANLLNLLTSAQHQMLAEETCLLL